MVYGVKKIEKYLVGEDTNEKERNKWIYTTIKSLPDGARILDAGAGELKWKKACSRLEYVSQDFCEYNGKGNNVGLQTGKWNTHKIDIVSDIIDIPVEDASFDAILCSEVLEHLPRPDLAIKEFSRILKRGGILIITSPFCSLTHFAPYHYSTGFNVYWYEQQFKEYDFDIVEKKRNGNYFSYIRQELIRLPEIMERYCGRKSVITKILSRLLIFNFKKHIFDNNKSGELLCFGYMIKAKKK